MSQTTVLPLHGVRILELTTVLSGPYGGSILCALGADVVKLESPRGGDPFRNYGTGKDDSPHFAQYNAGKRSIAIDVSQSGGVDAVKRLLPRFDVLFENGRPGRLDRVGLSAAACQEINPRLIYVSLTGFGNLGGLAQRPAYDAVAQAISGLLTTTNPSGQPPTVGPALGDMSAGIIGAMGVLLGLASRAQTGRGSVIETSMLEALSALIGDVLTQWFVDRREPSRDRRVRQSQVYGFPGSDGRYVVMHLSQLDKFWANLLKAVGREDLLADPRFATYALRMDQYDAIRAELAPAFERRTAAEWESLLARADVPVAVMLTVGEAAEHPQMADLELFNDARYAGVKYLRPPWRIDGRRPERNGLHPRLGEHTREVLGEALSQTEIADLERAGVILASA